MIKKKIKNKLDYIINNIYIKEKNIVFYNYILLTPFKILIPKFVNILNLNFFLLLLKIIKIKYKIYYFSIYFFSLPLLINKKDIEKIYYIILNLPKIKNIKVKKKILFYLIKKIIKKYLY
ncbi:MAG: hypothetical protein NHF88_00750 [Candidatus Shikimatogenerans bostrichidophilus]|nr:MAG: hypothetical protein NHF88_00750 [Candidatus Shikimatogenerans bostrichidophilus]